MRRPNTARTVARATVAFLLHALRVVVPATQRVSRRAGRTLRPHAARAASASTRAARRGRAVAVPVLLRAWRRAQPVQRRARELARPVTHRVARATAPARQRVAEATAPVTRPVRDTTVRLVRRATPRQRAVVGGVLAAAILAPIAAATTGGSAEPLPPNPAAVPAAPGPAPAAPAPATTPGAPPGVPAGVTHEQVLNARVIDDVASWRGLPPQATKVAIATALQESGLRNIDYGDRDSLGLFQQRPSAGWGTPDQIMDPHYSAAKFLDSLVQVPDWQKLPTTVAAQTVQRSAFPDAYAQWDGLAGRLTAAVDHRAQHAAELKAKALAAQKAKDEKAKAEKVRKAQKERAAKLKAKAEHAKTHKAKDGKAK